jgi:hypothetical protein
MGLNNIEILRQNGGIPATLPGEDHYSALLAYLAGSDMPAADAGVEGFDETRRIIQISTIEYAESLGIKADSEKWILRVLHYHLNEAFRINPAIMLPLGLFTKPAGAYSFTEVKTMQNFAEGKIRQISVYTPENTLTAGDLTTLQGIAGNLESNDMPLSILYFPKIESMASLTPMATVGHKNVSVVIGQAGSGVGKELFDEGAGKCVGLVGNALGMLSKMAVHESISWVAKCPSGIDTPAFTDGTLLKNTDMGVVNTLNDNQFIFLRTLGGTSGSFYNDSFTMDMPTSDYNAIERVRVMDKAVRGIRTYLLPHLSAPLYVDPASGKLRQDTVAVMTDVANMALEAMTKAGELSGHVVEIDPEQNVLASSTLEIVIRQVAVGVMRKIRVKIGFTNKIG